MATPMIPRLANSVSQDFTPSLLPPVPCRTIMAGYWPSFAVRTTRTGTRSTVPLAFFSLTNVNVCVLIAPEATPGPSFTSRSTRGRSSSCRNAFRVSEVESLGASSARMIVGMHNRNRKSNRRVMGTPRRPSAYAARGDSMRRPIPLEYRDSPPHPGAIMRVVALFSVGVLLATTLSARGGKDDLSKAVDARSDQAWEMARQIWGWAEPGYLEKKSSSLLAEAMEKAGFKVERGVAKIPTAFTATYGEGKPVIGILGEYDALPELAQDAVPERQPRDNETGYGHACGHHLFGVASATASMAIAEQIKAGTIKGTLRFYGCPAEEGGAAKVFMARAGLFSDCDVVLHWHPGSRNTAGDSSCLARIAVKFRFHGIASHASGAPERGRSALDALVLTMHAVELLREHTPDGTRLHHTVTSGGGAANVVPEFAEG